MTLAEHRANLALRSYLRLGEIHCHPDLAERLAEVVEGLGAAVPECAIPVIAHGNGVAFAFAQGTSALVLRLPPTEHAQVVEAPGSGDVHRASARELTLVLEERLGPEWVVADPWPIDIPIAEGLRQLRGWARAAFEHAASLA